MHLQANMLISYMHLITGKYTVIIIILIVCHECDVEFACSLMFSLLGWQSLRHKVLVVFKIYESMFV